MNILSFISSVVFTCFAVKVVYELIDNKNGVLSLPNILVNSTLGWWAFCWVFFLSAESKQDAWLWHKLGSIGWIGFIPAALYYFMVMTHYDKKLSRLIKDIVFAFIPGILFARTILFKGSPVAVDLVKSKFGYGWAYVNDIESFWFWAYVVVIFCYFGYSFWILNKWATEREVVKVRKVWMNMFILIDITVMSLGSITDFILPLKGPIFPPIATFCGLPFLIYCTFIIERKYDSMRISDFDSPGVIFYTIMEPIFLVDEHGIIKKANKAAQEMLGLSEKKLIHSELRNYYENSQELDEMLMEVLAGERIQNKEIKLFDMKMNLISAMASVSLAIGKEGSSFGIIISFKDITNLKNIENELRESNERNENLAQEYFNLANMDMLTGLPNRRCFFRNIENDIKLYEQRNEDFAIIYCDVDRFKYVNDTYGHQVGDKLLKVIAGRLKNCKSDNDLVSRMGGDEFTIILRGSNITDLVHKRIKELEEVFSTEILIDNDLIDVGISMGSAIYSEYKNIDKLLENADKCMYECKSRNRNKQEAL